MLRYGHEDQLFQNTGLCLLGVSLVIGFKGLMDLYAKIIGVEENAISGE